MGWLDDWGIDLRDYSWGTPVQRPAPRQKRPGTSLGGPVGQLAVAGLLVQVGEILADRAMEGLDRIEMAEVIEPHVVQDKEAFTLGVRVEVYVGDRGLSQCIALWAEDAEAFIAAGWRDRIEAQLDYLYEQLTG